MGACHARDIALSRALTEAAQARATVMAGTRDDFSADEYAVGRAPRGGRLPPHEPGTGKDFHACPDLAFAGSFRADLEDLIRRLVRDGREQVLRVDLTQPSIGIPVVNVIVPGLDNTFPAARFRSSNGAS
jgi:ribosomal protein S12 methylthiotransferase accessory factor